MKKPEPCASGWTFLFLAIGPIRVGVQVSIVLSGFVFLKSVHKVPCFGLIECLPWHVQEAPALHKPTILVHTYILSTWEIKGHLVYIESSKPAWATLAPGGWGGSISCCQVLKSTGNGLFQVWTSNALFPVTVKHLGYKKPAYAKTNTSGSRCLSTCELTAAILGGPVP